MILSMLFPVIIRPASISALTSSKNSKSEKAALAKELTESSANDMKYIILSTYTHANGFIASE